MIELNANKQQVFINYATKSWIKKGTAFDDLGSHEEALQAYDKALKLSPDDSDTWNRKGNALANLGRHEEALLAYDKALELDPDGDFAWYNKGNRIQLSSDHNPFRLHGPMQIFLNAHLSAP